MIYNSYKIIRIVMLSSIFTVLNIYDSRCQESIKRDILIYGQNWYGSPIITQPHLKSHGCMTYDVAIGFQTESSDECIFADSYGYPIISVGISVVNLSKIEFDDKSFLPDLYTVYGSFQRTMIRNEKYSLGFTIDLGLTTNIIKYDPVGNPGNTFLSSPVMCYFGCGFFTKYNINTHWDFGINISYHHYSNGMLSLPNGGLDELGCGIFANYHLKEYHIENYKIKFSSYNYNRGMIYHVSFSGGVHSCRSEWKAYNEMVNDVSLKQTKFKKHPKFCLSIDAMYRYHLKYATGVSLDLYYSSNMKELEQCDRILYGDEAVDNCVGYDPFSVGIAVVQELYWRNVAGYIALGIYPYRHKGISGYQGWHYEKAGIRYYFNKYNNIFTGFSIKAHNFDAENFEFTIGFKIG